MKTNRSERLAGRIWVGLICLTMAGVVLADIKVSQTAASFVQSKTTPTAYQPTIDMSDLFSAH